MTIAQNIAALAKFVTPSDIRRAIQDGLILSDAEGRVVFDDAFENWEPQTTSAANIAYVHNLTRLYMKGFVEVWPSGESPALSATRAAEAKHVAASGSALWDGDIYWSPIRHALEPYVIVPVRDFNMEVLLGSQTGKYDGPICTQDTLSEIRNKTNLGFRFYQIRIGAHKNHYPSLRQQAALLVPGPHEGAPGAKPPGEDRTYNYGGHLFHFRRPGSAPRSRERRARPVIVRL
ncbi:MAG: hypothetical protein LCH53_13105 [Bacteroidetes bacterium]|nr:hypothetical protein [Bacteroidota bacterium]